MAAQLSSPFESFLRGLLALAMMFYATAKLNHAQFTILDSQMDLPLREVSGFWLTWYYFGYSAIYGFAIALAQIIAAVMLLFRRTALFGAILLTPVLTNIVLIDLCFGIPVEGTLAALVLLMADIALVWNHRTRLALFLLPAEKTSAAGQLSKWVFRAAVLIVPAILTFWIANYNNRSPTPIDGAWKVVRVEPPSTKEASPQIIYFEYNRAEMCVFRTPGGTLETHGFKVDSATHALSIYKTWLHSDSLLFDESYRREGDTLTIEGSFAGQSFRNFLYLEREAMPIKNH